MYLIRSRHTGEYFRLVERHTGDIVWTPSTTNAAKFENEGAAKAAARGCIGLGDENIARHLKIVPHKAPRQNMQASRALTHL